MTYLVGYSPHKGDAGALDLACQFARSGQDGVHALTVVPRGWETSAGSATDGEFASWAAEEGEASAVEARAILDDQDVTATATWVAARSVPAAILEQAEQLQAGLIVVGSGLEGEVGRVRVTTKTDRLLHSSHAPVVIAPQGYAAPAGSRITRATLAFRDDDASWNLLDKVAEICRQAGAELRILTIALRNRTMVASALRADESLVFETLKKQIRQAQAEAVEHLAKSSVTVDTLIAEGLTWSEALGSVPWSEGDVLVVGSSRTHPLASVFLGSSAAKIVRNSPVPVVVVP